MIEELPGQSSEDDFPARRWSAAWYWAWVVSGGLALLVAWISLPLFRVVSPPSVLVALVWTGSLGYLQWRVVRHGYPDIRVGFWVMATVMGGLFGVVTDALLIKLTSTVHTGGLLEAVLIGTTGGLVMGSISLAQWIVMRTPPREYRWIGVNVALGLLSPWIYVPLAFFTRGREPGIEIALAIWLLIAAWLAHILTYPMLWRFRTGIETTQDPLPTGAGWKIAAAGTLLLLIYGTTQIPVRAKPDRDNLPIYPSGQVVPILMSESNSPRGFGTTRSSWGQIIMQMRVITPASPEQVRAFYNRALAQAGWRRPDQSTIYPSLSPNEVMMIDDTEYCARYVLDVFPTSARGQTYIYLGLYASYCID